MAVLKRVHLISSSKPSEIFPSQALMKKFELVHPLVVGEQSSCRLTC